MAAMSKANARQSAHRKGCYAGQRDRTPVNKAIKVARHIARYGDTKQKDVLRALPKLTLSHAASKLAKLMVASGHHPDFRTNGTPRHVLLQLAR